LISLRKKTGPFPVPWQEFLRRFVFLQHSSGGLHGGLHWYDGCGGLKVGTEMSGGIANVTFEDSHIEYSGAKI
jgi:hypothetical protein